MKEQYLLVSITGYKGGEIYQVETFDSILEALCNVSDYTPDTTEEWRESMLDMMDNKSIYAGGDSECFKIFNIKDNQVGREYDDKNLIEIINNSTIEDVNNIF